MKKHFILLLLTIFAALGLLASCTEKNDTGDTISQEILDNTFETAESADETSITQIGELTITIPQGQEPVQNEDGTITLPKGSTYEHSGGDKYTVLDGIVINNDGNLNMSLPENTGKKVTIEQANGDIIIYDENGRITVNGKTIEDMVNGSLSDLDTLNAIDWSFVTNIPWSNYTEDDNVIYLLDNGTKIIMPQSDNVKNVVINSSNVRFDQNITIEYANGITMEAPAKTMIEFKDDNTYIITIGDGDATIKKADGTKITLKSGAALELKNNESLIKSLGTENFAAIELPNSEDVITMNGDIITINNIMLEDIIADYKERMETVSEYVSKTDINIDYPWKHYSSGNNKVFELNDGTKFTMQSDNALTLYNASDNGYYIIFNIECTIECTNGVLVNAPLNTVAKVINGNLTVKIGDGDAEITQPDGTSVTVPSGSILDNEGNNI